MAGGDRGEGPRPLPPSLLEASGEVTRLVDSVGGLPHGMPVFVAHCRGGEHVFAVGTESIDAEMLDTLEELAVEHSAHTVALAEETDDGCTVVLAFTAERAYGRVRYPDGHWRDKQLPAEGPIVSVLRTTRALAQ